MAYGSTPSTSGIAGTINSLPKKADYLGLQDFPSIEFRDTTPFSDDFFNIVEFPDSLTAGKNLFKLKASAGTLVKDAKIYIEVLDSNGDTIYYEPIDYFEADGTRVVTIHVTANTPPGTAQVFLASRIRRNPDTGEAIPASKDWSDPNYINNPNLLWSRAVTVGPDRLNSSEIIFLRDSEPKVTVQEIVQPFLQTIDDYDVETAKNGIGTYQINQIVDTLIVPVDQMNPAAGNSSETIIQTGFSEIKTSEPFFSASMAGGYLTIRNPKVKVFAGFHDGFLNASSSPNLSTLGYVLVLGILVPTFGAIIDENGQLVPEANLGNVPEDISYLGQYSSSNHAVATVGNNAGDIIPVSGSFRFLISQVVNDSTARIVQLDGFNDDSLNTNGSFRVRIPQIQAVVDEDTNIDVIGTQEFYDSISAYRQTDSYTFKTDGENNNFTASFIRPLVTTTTQQSQSFAQITVGNLEPASGDVYKVRTLYKPGGMFGDFIDAGDTIVERVEILQDTSSFESDASVGTFYNRLGFFTNTNDFTTYFTSSHNAFKTTVNGNTNDYFGTPDNPDPLRRGRDGIEIIPEFKSSELINGIELMPSASQLPFGFGGDFGYVNLKPEYRPILQAGTTYELTFKAFATSSLLVNASGSNHSEYFQDKNYAESFYNVFLQFETLNVFISASAGNIQFDNSQVERYMQQSVLNPNEFFDYGFRSILDTDKVGMFGDLIGWYGSSTSSPYKFMDTQIGRLIGDIELIPNASIQDFSFIFTATRTEPMDLLFVPRRGIWTIADVSIQTLKETGYTPNFAQVNLRIPRQFNNTPLTFKFQFLDFLSRQADLEKVVYPVIFKGDNTVITGNNNLLQGSLYISNQIGTGMELAGTDSGFLRSTGYTGFKSASRTDQPGGFMIYSGSVLPSSPDNYQGVGLELVQDSSSFFRFKSNGPDAGLKVQTDKFFLGSDTSQFISGSNGLFEISSTNFTLSPEGDVTGSDMLLTGNARADMLEYKTVGINQDNSGSYLNTFTSLGKTYYELDLSSNAGMFVRIDCDPGNLLYPIARIKPPSGDSQAYAQTVYIESADGDSGPVQATGGVALAANYSSAGGVRTELRLDTGDLLDASFTTGTWNGTEYSKLYVLPSGCRVMCVKSQFDWKIQSMNNFKTATASFGAIQFLDGTTFTTTDVDGGSF